MIKILAVEVKDEKSGLFVRRRNTEAIKVTIPQDCLAFQVYLY